MADRLPLVVVNGQVQQLQPSDTAVGTRQEVYVDSQPTITYPAVSFTQVSGFTGLYLQSVNVP